MNPTEVCQQEYEDSQRISESLVTIILNGQSIREFNRHNVQQIKKDLKLEREERHRTKSVILAEELSYIEQHSLQQAKERVVPQSGRVEYSHISHTS